MVADRPSMHFETDETPKPWRAPKLYCAIAQGRADNIRHGRGLSDSYPIPKPTAEYAQMLLDRIAFSRSEPISQAR